MNRNQWIALALGFALGLALGLLFTWTISPVEYVDTAPASLRQDFRQEYMTLISAAYASTGDLNRAKARLDLFPNPDHATSLAALAQQKLAAGLPESETNPLALLASALSQESPPMPKEPPQERSASPSADSLSPAETDAAPSATPRSKPSATPGAPFRLVSKEEICDSRLQLPLIQVEVVDAAEQPVPGIMVLVIWDSGQDTFYTGLKSDMGLGYADFIMTEGVNYSLQVGDASLPVSNLSTIECESEDGEPFPGSWLLRFQQPLSEL